MDPVLSHFTLGGFLCRFSRNTYHNKRWIFTRTN